MPRPSAAEVLGGESTKPRRMSAAEVLGQGEQSRFMKEVSEVTGQALGEVSEGIKGLASLPGLATTILTPPQYGGKPWLLPDVVMASLEDFADKLQNVSMIREGTGADYAPDPGGGKMIMPSGEVDRQRAVKESPEYTQATEAAKDEPLAHLAMSLLPASPFFSRAFQAPQFIKRAAARGRVGQFGRDFAAMTPEQKFVSRMEELDEYANTLNQPKGRKGRFDEIYDEGGYGLDLMDRPQDVVDETARSIQSQSPLMENVPDLDQFSSQLRREAFEAEDLMRGVEESMASQVQRSIWDQYIDDVVREGGPAQLAEESAEMLRENMELTGEVYDKARLAREKQLWKEHELNQFADEVGLKSNQPTLEEVSFGDVTPEKAEKVIKKSVVPRGGGGDIPATGEIRFDFTANNKGTTLDVIVNDKVVNSKNLPPSPFSKQEVKRYRELMNKFKDGNIPENSPLREEFLEFNRRRGSWEAEIRAVANSISE